MKCSKLQENNHRNLVSRVFCNFEICCQVGETSKYSQLDETDDALMLVHSDEQGSNYPEAIRSEAMASGALWLGLDALYFYGILQYILALGALLLWHWNECPSKCVMRALVLSICAQNELECQVGPRGVNKWYRIMTSFWFATLFDSLISQMNELSNQSYCHLDKHIDCVLFSVIDILF